MANYTVLESKIKSMINSLQGLCNQRGLTNTANEEIVVTTVFLYKFLNDKFIANLKKFVKDVVDPKLEGDALNNKIVEVSKDEDLMDAFYDSYPQDVAFKYEDTINYLVGSIHDEKFYQIFDNTLVRIANYKKNESFSVNGADGSMKPLFEPISGTVTSKQNAFIKDIFSYITQDKFDFSDSLNENYDFFSTIFEYLISNYNKDSGDYAEYFTPQALSKAIAQILVGMSPIEDTIYDIYDPSAGSGSLVLHLANELGNGKFGNKARVYTQDVSQKSTRFLRINMLLNGLKESLGNIIEGDTLLSPAHFKQKGKDGSGLKEFDFITSNPPFKTDFSSTRNKIAKDWESTTRFFAGIPKIPDSAGKVDENGEKIKVKMAIYLCFIQHILYSLKPKGKAAIVVPTGFLTAKSGIEKSIRDRIIEKKWLRGVVSMPSNIFANTGTNVSVMFIDKSNYSDSVLLMDASGMGTKVKVGGNQKTVLSDEELNKIVDFFINNKEEHNFSVLVSFEQIEKKESSFAASQYFKVKINYHNLTENEFDEKMKDYNESFSTLFEKSQGLNETILSDISNLVFVKKDESED